MKLRIGYSVSAGFTWNDKLDRCPAQLTKTSYFQHTGRPVWSAAKRGSAVELKRLIEADERLVNVLNPHNETALHLAAEYGKTTCVALLLEMGAKSTLSIFGETPISLAAKHGHAEIVRLLCRENQLGTSEVQAEILLSAATTRGDKATAAVLHRHLHPELDVPHEEDDRANLPIQLLEEERLELHALSEEIRETAVLRPPDLRPPLGKLDEWSSNDLEYWAQGILGLEAASRQTLCAFARYHITGRTLLLLTTGEQRTLFQRIGIPSQQRRELLSALGKLQGRPKIYSFTEIRLLPLVLGNATAFRIIGYVRAAMSTPLHTCRRFVATAKELTRPVPEPFLFLSMQNEKIPKDKENSNLVAALGFVVCLVPDT